MPQTMPAVTENDTAEASFQASVRAQQAFLAMCMAVVAAFL